MIKPEFSSEKPTKVFPAQTSSYDVLKANSSSVFLIFCKKSLQQCHANDLYKRLMTKEMICLFCATLSRFQTSFLRFESHYTVFVKFHGTALDVFLIKAD